jgi:hypothetical protein
VGVHPEGAERDGPDGATESDPSAAVGRLSVAELEARAAAAAAAATARKAFANAGAFFAEITAARAAAADGGGGADVPAGAAPVSEAGAEARELATAAAAVRRARGTRSGGGGGGGGGAAAVVRAPTGAPEGSVAAAAAAFDSPAPDANADAAPSDRPVRRRRRSFSSLAGAGQPEGDADDADSGPRPVAAAPASKSGRVAFTAARGVFQSAEGAATVVPSPAAATAVAAAGERPRRWRRGEDGRSPPVSRRESSVGAADDLGAATAAGTRHPTAARWRPRPTGQQEGDGGADAAGAPAPSDAASKQRRWQQPPPRQDDAGSGAADQGRPEPAWRTRHAGGAGGDADSARPLAASQLAQQLQQALSLGDEAGAAAAGARPRRWQVGPAAPDAAEALRSATPPPTDEPFVFGRVSERRAALLQLQSQLQEAPAAPAAPAAPSKQAPAAPRWATAAADRAAAAAEADLAAATGHHAPGFAQDVDGGAASWDGWGGGEPRMAWYGQDGNFFSQRRMRHFRHQQMAAHAAARKRGGARRGWLPQLFAAQGAGPERTPTPEPIVE